jgi:hypothetical protein
MDQQRQRVYGELVEDLLPGLVRVRDGMQPAPDGGFVFWTTLTDVEAAPLRRALLRAEAQLATEADRTAGQRSAEALRRVVTALSATRPKN